MFKSQELVIKELKELFDTANNIKNGSYETNGKFGHTTFEVCNGVPF